MVELHIAPAVLAELQRCSHKVTVTETWALGKVMGIHYDMACGVTIDRATLKGIIGYAIGW